MLLKKIRLGKTNLQVTQLGFGSIPIQRRTEEEALAVVRRCLELGITFLDTAFGYTTSEERIGKAVAGGRNKVVIATKTPPAAPEIVEKNLQTSLKRLNTDYIDLYQLHGVSSMDTLEKVLAPDGALTALKKARKDGLIKHIGISSHQLDVAKKAVETDQFETLMFPFNFMASEAAEVLLPLCRRHDVGFIAMKPLAGGMVDDAVVCFKYLLQFPDIAIIPGIERIAEIDEIYKIVQEGPQMSRETQREMDRIKNELGASFCHRCDYCQPCESHIPISMVLGSASLYKRLPPERFFGDMVAPAMKQAVDCRQCGDCESRCPYHLPIRQMLSEQVKWFEAEKKKYQENCKF